MGSSYIKRKCSYCGELIDINRSNMTKVIYYDKKTYHSRCFINMCNAKSESKRKDVAQKWRDVISQIDFIESNSFNHFNLELSKNDIFDFIRDNYNITIIPSCVWHKLGNIYNGTFKGMIKGIPPDHLLDMWKRKINMLNRIYSENISKGKCMTPEQRVNYDLSILVNKYDSYLKWMEKQNLLASEQVIETEENIVNNSIGYINNDSSKNNSDNISKLVDEIFGE